ncbi:MAG: preprotein translocase subunit SecD [Actinomycetota bacterium]|nr:preprotein translocase subunit SecD [Actinomycetota bacterium]
MAGTQTASRPGRSIAVLAVLTALVFALIYFVAPDRIGTQPVTTADKYQPRLGLDLEGGTSVILKPRVAPGKTGTITKDSLNQAVGIIRQRVDSFGVAEAEVTTAGQNITISVPGKQDKNILATVQQTAELRFRPVLLAGPGGPVVTAPSPSPSGSASPSGSPSPSASRAASPSPSPSTTNNGRAIPRTVKAGTVKATGATPTATPPPSASATAPATPATGAAGDISPALQQEYARLDCSKTAALQQALRKPGADDPKKSLVTCLRDGTEKYILGPAEVLGTDVKTASAGLANNSQGVATGGWQVNLTFTGKGRVKFADVTRRLAALSDPRNRFGIVLDGLVVSAPGLNNGPIVGGSAQITGSFTQAEATDLANVLKYGALPLTFDAGQVQEVSATLGGDQLRAGLIAGAIGLFLVVLYSLLYYRGLGLVTVASLGVSAILTYGLVVLLGWQLGFRLSLAGIAGLIVAIGITADSFIVFFERLRDEVRDGKTLRVAVETGWVRARRTILAADFVSFLAAMILYILSAGGVRGFAFTLGLTTLLDIAVVFMFTKPLVTILARTSFFGQGSKWSGLDPERLGSTRRSLLTPAPRKRAPAAPATGTATSTPKEA